MNEQTKNNKHHSVMLELSQLSLKYAAQNVVEDLNLQLNKGDIAAILGPSGSGKTSILRSIAGFMPLAKGKISIDEALSAEPNFNRAPNERGVGLVFQDFALFPHLTVAKNIEFGLHALDDKAKKERVEEYMSMLDIVELAEKYPAQLSGGQQQRVAIARAIAPQPKLLLMDEAFSSLDPSLREQIAQELRAIIKALGLTAVLVTHDQNEAFAFADKIAVIANKSLQQFSTPFDLYHTPKTEFVANFIGDGVFVDCTVNDNNDALISKGLGQFKLADKSSLEARQSVKLLLRPDDIVIDLNGECQAEITAKHFKGANIRYELRLSDTSEMIMSNMPSHFNRNIGEQVGITTQIEHLIYFAK